MNYEISRTADFIRSRNFTRVALQFPDDLLKDSTRVASALREKLRELGTSDVGIFVMADATYGSCCVDEVGASHIDADCVVHYGHTCLSPTSTLPAFFVFGKASVDVKACVESLLDSLSISNKPILVLFGLEYAHAIQSIKEAMIVESSRLGISKSSSVVHYADVICSIMDPSEGSETQERQLGLFNSSSVNDDLLKYVDSINIHKSNHCKQMASPITNAGYSLGGLAWTLPQDHNMEDYLLFWIGADNPAFANVVLTFNNCEIVRYDAEENCLVKDVSHQKRILKRRYYLVERAKDANIVGILVGTLGVAGYLHMIRKMKELIKQAGKNAYTLVMGRPNPAKLANFPECDVFVYVSCAQTALWDSKEFLAPVITPFEAMLAFSSGCQWTGAYVIEFQDLMMPYVSPEVSNSSKEARFSFIEGAYVEDLAVHGEVEEEKERALVSAETTNQALQVGYTPSSFVKRSAKFGAEFFATRSFQGLDIQNEILPPQVFITGRTGKASGYDSEKTKGEVHD